MMRSRDADDRQAKVARIESGILPLALSAEDAGSQAMPMDLCARMNALKVPGVSLAVVEHGQLSWARSYGVRKAGTDQAIGDKTLFEIGSTTKLVTAIVALQLVEKGMIGLDEDVNLALVGWKIPESEYTVSEKVTLRRLLNHTSGIPATNFNWEMDSTPALEQVLRGEFPADNAKATVTAVPGSEHAYSNLGYVVIQRLIEDITAKPFSEVVQAHVLGPLGMDDSTFNPDPANHLVCLPHDGDGIAHPLQLHPSAIAQGGLLSTPSDLARLAIDLMEGAQGRSSRVLQPDTIQRMLQPDPQLDIEKWSGFTDGQGLGLFLLKRGDNMKFLAPGMNLPGSTGLILAWPARGFAVTLTTNGLNGQQLQVEILNSIGVEYGLDWGLQIG